MNNYEALSILISILSLAATIFFGITVLKLSQKANEIAQESLNIAKEAFAAQVTKEANEFKEDFSDHNSKNVAEFNKNQEKLQKNKNFMTYNKGIKQVKTEEYKKWKAKNELIKKRFLK